MSEIRLGLIVDGPPMTKEAAEAIGRTWLAQDHDHLAPITVVYRDVEGRLVYGQPIHRDFPRNQDDRQENPNG